MAPKNKTDSTAPISSTYSIPGGSPLVLSTARDLDKGWDKVAGGAIALEAVILQPSDKLTPEGLFAVMGGGSSGTSGGVLSDGTARIVCDAPQVLGAGEQNLNRWLNGNQCAQHVAISKRSMNVTSTRACDATREGASAAVAGAVFALPSPAGGWTVTEERDQDGKLQRVVLVPS